MKNKWEIYQALADKRKIKITSWLLEYHIHINENGDLVDEDGTQRAYSFEDWRDWEIKRECFDLKTAVKLSGSGEKLRSDSWNKELVLKTVGGWVAVINIKNNSMEHLRTEDFLATDYYIIEETKEGS